MDSAMITTMCKLARWSRQNLNTALFTSSIYDLAWVVGSTLAALPSSESWLSLVSCSICWHQPSMRPVSACSSFRNQWPSLRHSVPPPPLWGTLLLLPFPLSSQGSGGGKDDGSSAGSRLSEKEEELLRVVERLRICLGGGGEEMSPVVSPLSKESCPGGELMDWLALLTMTFFSECLTLLIWEMKWMSCVSESVSCFEAMLLEPLSLKQQGDTLLEMGLFVEQEFSFLPI